MHKGIYSELCYEMSQLFKGMPERQRINIALECLSDQIQTAQEQTKVTIEIIINELELMILNEFQVKPENFASKKNCIKVEGFLITIINNEIKGGYPAIVVEKDDEIKTF
jgi:hypothetical protein